MFIPVPIEVVEELGFPKGIFLSIKEKPTPHGLKMWLDTTNTVLDRISGAIANPISRTIPIQDFKNKLLELEENT